MVAVSENLQQCVRQTAVSCQTATSCEQSEPAAHSQTSASETACSCPRTSAPAQTAQALAWRHAECDQEQSVDLDSHFLVVIQPGLIDNAKGT